MNAPTMANKPMTPGAAVEARAAAPDIAREVAPGRTAEELGEAVPAPDPATARPDPSRGGAAPKKEKP